MKLVKTLLATTVLVSVAGLAMAADNGGMMGNGPFYGDLNLGASTDFRSDPDVLKGIPGISFDKYHFAGSANFGKMINNNWGVEAGYAYMPGFEISGAGADFESTNHVFDVAAKGVYSLGNNVSFFGKLGPAIVYNKLEAKGFGTNESDNATTLALFYAAGAAYDINSNLSVNAQVSGVSNSKSNSENDAGFTALGMKKKPALMMISAGIGYNFGA